MHPSYKYSLINSTNCHHKHHHHHRLHAKNCKHYKSGQPNIKQTNSQPSADESCHRNGESLSISKYENTGNLGKYCMYNIHGL